MTRLLAGLLAVTVTFGSAALAREHQGKSLYVVVSDRTNERGGFQPDDHPPNVPNTIARWTVALLQKDVRLAAGQIITGFSFDGQTEGDGVRIVVSTLVPGDRTNRYVEVKPGTRPSFRKREFTKFTLSPGEKRSIDEMKAGQTPSGARLAMIPCCPRPSAGVGRNRRTCSDSVFLRSTT